MATMLTSIVVLAVLCKSILIIVFGQSSDMPFFFNLDSRLSRAQGICYSENCVRIGKNLCIYKNNFIPLI